jgi:hypothetical protein
MCRTELGGHVILEYLVECQCTCSSQIIDRWWARLARRGKLGPAKPDSEREEGRVVDCELLELAAVGGGDSGEQAVVEMVSGDESHRRTDVNVGALDRFWWCHCALARARDPWAEVRAAAFNTPNRR